ncbi:MAG: nucleoside kinase [Bacteroidales bacterium]|nr:nucleoside kinase [Bacteroidales bacterium]
MIQILCKNDGKYYKVKPGSSLLELSRKVCTETTDPKTGARYPVLAALVDHKLKELGFSLFYPHEVEFIGYNHPDGKRSYIRSLCFMLQHAVRTLFPDRVLVIDHSLPSGLYCELQDPFGEEGGSPRRYRLQPEELRALRERMQALAEEDLPFTSEKIPSVEAQALFLAQNQPCKADLHRSLGRYFCRVYHLGDQVDSFHGPLVISTGQLKVFDLMRFHDGFCLQYPSEDDISRPIPRRPQTKLAATLKDYSQWCTTTGIVGIGTLNKTLLEGGAVPLINLCEARQERKYAEVADQVWAERDRVKIVFIAGPSSSGKTSSSLRLAQQCRVLGMNPKVIELDNYFVPREQTPVDEDGNFDFESLGAMNLDLLGCHLNALLQGDRVELPRFDFKSGVPVFEGNYMQLKDNDILIMEGIHALDPAMVPSVDPERIFRVYASALTSLNVDENNNISTTDNRLLRRIVRDNRTRGVSPEQTILRWPSVRRGENKYIFPFQENADVQFNSALLYELPLLKYYAEPLLRRIHPSSPAYSEAVRLLKFLDYIVALQPSEISAVPPTSILREFIGGQRL